MFKKLLLLVTLITTITVGQHITGIGTTEDPYILYNAADIDSIAILGKDLHYALGNDIDYGSTSPTKITNFNGYLDGNGYTIKNIAFTGAAAGLFDGIQTDTTTIHDLTFYNCSWVKTAASFDNYNAILMGYIGIADIDNIRFIKCSIDLEGTYAIDNTNYWIGLLAGLVYGGEINRVSIDSCDLSIYANCWNGGAYVALLIGRNTANINECAVTNSTMYGVNSWGYPVTMSFNGFSPLGQMVNTVYVKNSFTNNITIDGGDSTYISSFSGFADEFTQPDSIVNCYSARISFVNIKYNRKYPFFRGTPDAYKNNFTDTTTAHSALGLAAGISGKDSTEMQSDTMFVAAGWDFSNNTGIWGQSPISNGGYPFLLWQDYPLSAVTITLPTGGEIYDIEDTIAVIVETSGTDSVVVEFSNDNMFSWTVIDTIAILGVTDTLNWYYTVSGDYYIKAYDLHLPLISDTTNEFYISTNKSIEILSPEDSISTLTVGATINIMVRTNRLSSFALWYAIGDSVNWILIEDSVATSTIGIDTTTYSWALPNIYGIIFLKAASEVDSAKYDFNQTAFGIGGQLPANPYWCWYDNTTGYFSTPITFPSWAQSYIQKNWIYDGSCGWAYYGTWPWTRVLSSDGTHYEDLVDRTYHTVDSILSYPLYPDAVHLVTLIDTTDYQVAALCASGDSVTYKNRQYFIDASDSTLKCKDLINDIDSIFVSDLSPLQAAWSAGVPDMLQVYNIERDAVEGEYIPTNVDIETYNSALFQPVILVGGPATSGRGDYIARVVALDAPVDGTYVEDIIRALTSLTIRRDYFRGIDPKARKSGR